MLPSGAGSDSLRDGRATGSPRCCERSASAPRSPRSPTPATSRTTSPSGDYDLALYSWPGTAYPATDARPIFAKPLPAPDGSLTVEQNYTRVGTDQIDQLFDQAVAELDEDAARDLITQADARIWAAAGSIPLYQRPAAGGRATGQLANAGAFGFADPPLPGHRLPKCKRPVPPRIVRSSR